MASQLFNSYTSINGTLAESVAKITYLENNNIDAWNSLIFDTKRKSIWAQGQEYGRQADSVSSAESIQTVVNNTDATYFLTFVDSNNSTKSNENLYTNQYIDFNPSGGRFSAKSLGLKRASDNSQAFAIYEDTTSNVWNINAAGGSSQINFMTNNTGGSTVKLSITKEGNLLPGTNNAQNIGSSSLKWLHGYITNMHGTADAVLRATFGDKDNGEHDANNINSNGLWYYNANGPTTTQGATSTDGALYSQAYSTNWVGQIAQDYRNGRLFFRGKNNGTWTAWLTNVDSGNIASQNVNSAGYLRVGYCRGDSSPSNSGEWSRIKNGTTNPTTARAQVWTVYNDGGPTSYGEVLEILSANTNHWQPQLWFGSGKGGHLYYRNKDYNNDSWGSWLTILDSSNYASYLGYIGTTAVQASSAAQALTGISSINGCVTITSGSDIASIGFIGNHTVEFGNSGYAHRSYYFRPAYSASGATQTNLYIQNASAAASPTFTTTHAFTANGNAYHSGNIIIETGDNDRYIHFRYDSNNYAGASWRLLSRGSGTGDTNYFDIETGGSTSTANTWYRVLRLTMDNRYVGVGVDAPTQKLHVGGNGRFDGGIGSKGTNGNATGAYIVHPGGGVYATSTSSVTGYLKITLPHKGKNTMMSFDVTIYTYNGDYQSYVTYHISGYEYSTNGWYDPVTKVYSEGIGPYTNLTVRLGNDGTYACITIGESNTVWTYPQVTVHNIMTGYSNCDIDTWVGGWSVGFTTTALTTIVSEKTSVNKQNISVTSADKLNFERVSDIHATTGWRVFTTTNNTPSNGPSSNWMQGITFLPNNDQNGYRNILAFLGAGTDNDLWIQTQSGGTWGNWRKVLTSANYTSYLGYIGTTAVQANSANQDLTGINTLTITNTTATGHIIFSRASWNYLTAPASGSIAFVTNGKTAGSANTDLVIKNTEVSPGTNSYSSLGSTSVRWKQIYSGMIDVLSTDVNSYNEGIRIHVASNGWAALTLCGSDNTGVSGTSAKSWAVLNNDGTFYINKNASSTATTSRAMATANGWTFGNTSSNTYAVNATQMYADTWMRAGNGFYVHDKGVHYMSNGQNGQGQIYLISNEFNWQSGNTNLYFNYRAGSNGTTVTNYIWNAGSSTTYANHTMGTVDAKSWIRANSTVIYRLTLPSQQQAPGGWFRMAKITGHTGYLNIILLIHGSWNTGAPTQCIIHMSACNTSTYITQLAGYANNTSAVRLVGVDGSAGHFWFDVCVSGTGEGQTRGPQQYTIIGNCTIENAYSPTAVTAAASDTTGNILSLGTMTGINITSSNYTTYCAAKNHNHDYRYTVVYNASNATAINNASSSVTVNNLAAAGTSAVGMIYAATDNPVGSANWVHVWSQAWQAGVNTSWVSQIALGAQQSTGMWYRTSSGTAVGRAWIRVLDSSNYTSYTVTKTGSGASGTWGISISGNAATVSRATFGDASNGSHDCNAITTNGLWYYNANGPSGIGNSTSDGALYSQAYNANWVGQIAQDYRNGRLFVRGRNNGTWTAWQRVALSTETITSAAYGTTATNAYYKISINSYTSWMLSFTIRLYQAYKSYDIRISGYNYGANHWYTPKASMIDGDAAITVYFGYDSDYHLWVTVPGSNYTGIAIFDVVNGYTQTGLSNSGLFTITAVSAIPSTQQTSQTVTHNADTIDGYHIVVGSTGTAANTIYIL